MITAERVAEIFSQVPEVSPAETIYDSSLVTRCTISLGARAVDWALYVARSAADDVRKEIAPSRFELLSDNIGAAIESISLNLIRSLAGGSGVGLGLQISRGQRDSIVNSVRAGIPAASQVGGLRILERHWKRALTQVVLTRYPRADALDLLLDVDDWLSTFFDTLIDQTSTRFSEEAQRLMEKRLIGQRQLIERIIAGRTIEPEVFEDVLGLPAGAVHHAFLVAGRGNATGATGLDFASFRHAFERQFRDMTIAVVPADRETSWAIASGRRLSATDIRSRLDAVLAEVPEAATSVGLPHAGPGGLRVACVSATMAHTLNERSATAGPIVMFEEQGWLCLAIANPEVAQWFVSAEVGPLLEGGQANQQLRRTLTALLANNGSLVKTAEELFVHRNTITYRLKRIEEVLQRDPLARPLETHIALLLASELEGIG